ncbi:MAG: sulfatase [Acidobacteriota bacterium]|nr:sulfatase [Acidobacteriota bacterium]
MRWPFSVLVPLTLLVLALGCGGAQPSVVLISIDSLRADVPGSEVAGRPLTPVLDRFARQATVYTRAISAAPWTTPAMMSVMTGLGSGVHGVEEHDRALASTVPTLAERFRAAGYRTAAFTPAVTLRAEYGFSRGFEVYDQDNFGHNRLSSPTLVGKVLARLEEWKDEPFFIWVHLWDPHYNYIPPAPWNGYFRTGRQPPRDDVQCLKWVENPVSPEEAQWFKGQYDGEVAYTDQHLGQILDQVKKLGLEETTVVAVMADHGEAFLEHGWLGHTNRLDETLIHVPLMVRQPGAEGRRIDSVVPVAGLGRSLLELAAIDGRDFGDLPALPAAVQTPADERPVLSRTLRRGCWTALSTTRFKYLLEHRQCREFLFDLEQDPGETTDLSATQPERLLELRAALSVELERGASLRVARSMLPREIIEQAEARLRSIGYVGGAPTGGGDSKEVTCAKIAAPGRVDAFGDAAAQPCPEGAVHACLEVLGKQQP